MGGNRFYTRQKGMSISEAYRDAVRLAEQEYGHQQGYSGEINSTGGVIDLTKSWKTSKLSINKFIAKTEKENTLTKGNAYGICTLDPKKSPNKIKSHVEHNVEKGTKKWVLRYVISTSEDDYITSCVTKGEAVKAARKYTESTAKTTFVNMEKVLETGSSRVARINYKSAKNDAMGEYLFFGIAPC